MAKVCGETGGWFSIFREGPIIANNMDGPHGGRPIGGRPGPSWPLPRPIKACRRLWHAVAVYISCDLCVIISFLFRPSFVSPSQQLLATPLVAVNTVRRYRAASHTVTHLSHSCFLVGGRCTPLIVQWCMESGQVEWTTPARYTSVIGLRVRTGLRERPAGVWFTHG